jgi:uncharacterized protein (TIGR02147 family)
MEADIFTFAHYRDYLLHQVGPKSERRGIKIKLSSAIKCQPSMLSQVLSGTLDLSLEQGADVNRFFRHGNTEAHFFLLLLSHARAATAELKQYYAGQIDGVRRDRLVLSKRLEKSRELSAEHRSTYYSSWHYSAVHIATTIATLQNYRAIADFFAFPEEKARSILAFLESAGLIANDNGRLHPTDREIFLGSDSAHISSHHKNWRMQAIESLDRAPISDLHYSAVISLSREDAVRIKERCMQHIQEVVSTVRDSKDEEVLYALDMDFFSLAKNI